MLVFGAPGRNREAAKWAAGGTRRSRSSTSGGTRRWSRPGTQRGRRRSPSNGQGAAVGRAAAIVRLGPTSAAADPTLRPGVPRPGGPECPRYAEAEEPRPVEVTASLSGAKRQDLGKERGMTARQRAWQLMSVLHGCPRRWCSAGDLDDGDLGSDWGEVRPRLRRRTDWCRERGRRRGPGGVPGGCRLRRCARDR
jgi:hypothetical protein